MYRENTEGAYTQMEASNAVHRDDWIWDFAAGVQGKTGSADCLSGCGPGFPKPTTKYIFSP